MTVKIGINGFGRIGRLVLRAAADRDDVEVVGRLYDFTVTNIDGSETTGDKIWKEAIFSSNEEAEYALNKLENIINS